MRAAVIESAAVAARGRAAPGRASSPTATSAASSRSSRRSIGGCRVVPRCTCSASARRSTARSRRRCARAGRGVEVMVGLDEDAERGAKRLLDRTSMPMLTNVEISGSALLAPRAGRACPTCSGARRSSPRSSFGPRAASSSCAAARARRVGADARGARAALGRKRGRRGAVRARARRGSRSERCSSSGRTAEIEDLGLSFQIATQITSWVAIDEARTRDRASRDAADPAGAAVRHARRGVRPARRAGRGLGTQSGRWRLSTTRRSSMELRDDASRHRAAQRGARDALRVTGGRSSGASDESRRGSDG